MSTDAPLRAGTPAPAHGPVAGTAAEDTPAAAALLDAALRSLLRTAEEVLRLSRHAADTEEATAELHRRLAVAGSGAPGEHRRLAEAHLARARNDRALAARAAAVLACHRSRGGHEEPQPGTRRPATPVPPPR